MSTSMVVGRRSSVEIVHDILSLCDNGGINKTAIMYRGNLNYNQLRKYLSALCEEALVTKTETGKYQITSEGHVTLKRISIAIKTLRDVKEELGIAIQPGGLVATVNHAYTHFRITLNVYMCRHVSGTPRANAHTELKWVRPKDFDRLAFPKANHKFLHLL